MVLKEGWEKRFWRQKRCAASGPAAPASSARPTSGARATLARRRALVEIGRVHQLRRGAVMHGEAPGDERRGAELAPLVHRVKLEVEPGSAALIQQPGLRQLRHPLQRLEAG